MTTTTTEKKGELNLILRPPSMGKQTRGKNVVRDFIYGCWCNGRRIGGMEMPPLNELYVATILNKNGLPADFLDADIQADAYKILESDNFSGLFSVILMVSTQSFTNDILFLERLKEKNPGCHAIIFGSHPTFMPDYCLDKRVVDFIVRGEAEFTILELVDALSNGRGADGIEGIGYVDSRGEKKLNPLRPFGDMDDLPIPDRGLLPEGIDYFNPVVKRVPYTTIQTSRGCPYRCIFCTAPTFYGKKARFRSADNVIEELRTLIKLGYREVFFRDETFTAYSKRNHGIFEQMIKEKMDLTWIANARVDTVDRETLALMKKAGCHMVKFGVESGDDEVLNNYQKGITTEKSERAIGMARELGLETHAHIVLGGPGETPETIQKTIKFALKLNPSTATFGILTPFPGTELFDRVAGEHPEIRDGSESNLENLHTTGYFSEAMCGLSGEYLSKQITRAYRAFYLRPSYIFRQLRGVTSVDGFFRLATAGSNIFQFALTGEK